jgi:hypothetical protein
MGEVCSEEDRERQIRLDAAIDLVALSSARLNNVILAGPGDTADWALAQLRLARMRLLEAQADCREFGQLTD